MNEIDSQVNKIITKVLNDNNILIKEAKKHREPQWNYYDARNYSPKNSPHLPVYTHRKHVDGEFRVFYDLYYKIGGINEEKESQYPQTMPTESTIKFIKEHYDLDDAIYRPIYRRIGDSVASVVIVSVPDKMLYHGYETELEILDKLFKSCGYFRSTPDRVYSEKDFDEDAIRDIQYEAYHFEAKKRLTIPGIIYHVTTTDLKDSILENGFIASCNPSVNWLQYPPRNYFFTKFSEDLMRGYMYNAHKIPFSNTDNNKVTIFRLRSSYLQELGIKFYSDPRFQEKEAVYTYDDIPTEAIIEYIDTLF